MKKLYAGTLALISLALHQSVHGMADAFASNRSSFGHFVWMSDLDLDRYNTQATLTVFDARTMQPLGHKSAIGHHAEFSPNEQLVATLTEDKHHRTWITLYELPTMQCIGRPVSGDWAEFSPDSTMLWVKDRGEDQALCHISIYETKKLSLLGKPAPGDNAVWSRDSQWALIRSWDEYNRAWVTLYLAEEMCPVAPAIPGHDAQFNPNGQFVWVKNLVHQFTSTGTIQVYAIPTMRPVNQLIPGDWAQFGPDGYSLIVCPETRCHR